MVEFPHAMAGPALCVFLSPQVFGDEEQERIEHQKQKG